MKQLTCIICPRGCALTAEGCGGNVMITGNGCSRGVEYGINECLNPVRTVTIALRVTNRPDTMIAVKTETPIPKDKMSEAADILRKLAVHAPVAVGDVLAEDIFGSRILAAQSVP